VLVPLDGSTFGDSIVYHAARLAEALNAPLALYTVAIPNAIPMAPFGAEALLADEGDLSHQEQEARERLTALAGTLPANCTVDVGTDMTAARPIIEKAAAIGASVIAMATHGRTGLARLVMGSVADAVLRDAPQALLLYRPTDREQH
jgi:nucleotide-binding universal stress UspA family protein